MKINLSNLIKLLPLLGFLICSIQVEAQIDASSGSIQIKGEVVNKLPDPISISPTAPKSKTEVKTGGLIFKSNIKLSDPWEPNKKKEINFMEGHDFAKPSYKKLEDKLNNAQAKDKEKLRPEYYRDQYLGDFKSGSKFINFTYRDHGAVDGDLVSVSVNGEIVHPRLFLEGEFRGFYLDLKKGFNKIEIKALNQGSVGANTAQFVMYDDMKKVISSNTWFLASGFTATVVIVKEDDDE